MPTFANRTRSLAAGCVVVAMGVALVPSPAGAGACRKTCADATRPTVVISSPGAGSTVSGTVAVSGTAADNVSVAKVEVEVDGGAWQAAVGTSGWSWSWATGSLANGSHSLAARSTDAAGNVSNIVSQAVTVSNPLADTTAPTVTISSPLTSATVSGTIAVSGSAADNVSLATVQVAVDGGAWQLASGTASWSWSWSTTSLADGTHTVTARATDRASNASVSSVTVSTANPVADTTPPVVAVSAPTAGSAVSGSVSVGGTASDGVGLSRVDVAVDGGAWSAASGTSSWSWPWSTASVANGSHTITARATDTSGNVASASATVTVSNSTTAPNTQGTWVSPEGVHISVASAGPWTISQIYQMLTSVSAASGDFAKIAPDLTVNVQDSYASQTAMNATGDGTVYTNYSATIWLKGVNSRFAGTPDDILNHEYGHAWAHYYLYLAHQGDWSSYLSTRWDTADGSVVLGQDSRLDSSMPWARSEIIADDYRLLFGSAAAISENPSGVNTIIPDPRNQPGLASWLLTTWRAGAP